MAASPLSEDELIARFFAPMAGEGSLRLTDDAAIINPPRGNEIVVTVDALVAGVHFFADDAAASVAKKALRVNLSDLAAKGAEPLGFLLSLALPADWTEGWLGAFAEALRADATAYGCPLLGGDTVKTPGPLSISVTAFGKVPRGSMVRRSGAQVGDAIAVTGTIGDAALGLMVRKGDASVAGLSGSDRTALVERYLHPKPRLLLLRALRRHASAAIDVSDGLVGDLAKLLRVSSASAEIDVDAVPLSSAARAAIAAHPALRHVALTGGDDYEVIMTLPVQAMNAMTQASNKARIALTRIGTVVEGTAAPRFFDRNGSLHFEKGSFQHF